MARVNRDFVSLRVTLEHRDLAIGQFVLVLVDVRRSDGEQRFFVGERVGQKAFAVHRAGVFRQAAGPRRDRTVSVARLLGAQRRQAGTELVRFFGGNRCHHIGGQQAESQNAALQNHLAH
ncbi:hypothetical protein D3C73_1275840 [compost metagenome]